MAGDLFDAAKLQMQQRVAGLFGIPQESFVQDTEKFEGDAWEELKRQRLEMEAALLNPKCVFCDRIEKDLYLDATEDRQVVWFRPLNPVVPDHILFVPSRHVPDAAHSPFVTGKVMTAAAGFASKMNKPFNLITSSGIAATQSVFHLHIHYVPREEGDGLALPWTGQNRTKKIRKIDPEKKQEEPAKPMVRLKKRSQE